MKRIRRVFGEVAREEIAAIDEGLALFLRLGDRLHGPGGSRTGSMRPGADGTDLACAKAPSRKYRRSRLPLPLLVLRGTAVEVMVVFIGQIRGQGVVLNRISGEPS